jgi:pimeloyl-ACP methyl ester carboxylesterase
VQPTTDRPSRAHGRPRGRWSCGLALVATLVLAACTGAHEASPTAVGSTVEHFETADGLQLDGRLFAAHGSRLVILLHEYDGDQRDWYGFARELAGSGEASALTFDFRGYGASQGRRSTGEGLVTDVLAAVDFAHARGYRSVVVIGASMGAAAGIIAASENPSIAGVIALSPVAIFGGMNVIQAIHDRRPSSVVLMATEGDVSAMDSMTRIEAAAQLPSADVRTYPGDSHGAAMLTSSIGALVTRHIDTLLQTMWPVG